MSVLALYGTILLVCMARDLMLDPNTSEECVEILILTTPIGLYRQDFSIEGVLNKTLKGVEDMKHFRFVANKINPSMFTKVINKVNIVILSSDRRGCMTPNI
jgi:hypothetical protein